jgi:hypothetical protein
MVLDFASEEYADFRPAPPKQSGDEHEAAIFNEVET